MTSTPTSSLPIRMDSTSNGEFMPRPLPTHLRAANRDAAERLEANARKVGLDRRRFMAGLTGAATTLLAFNRAFAAHGHQGGSFMVPPAAGLDGEAAQAALASDDLIFDVQTHLVDPQGPWRRNAGRAFERVLAWWPQGTCGEEDPTDCYGADHFIREIFLDSDTDLAVLSFVPTPEPYNSLSLEEADRVRRLIDRLDGDHRLLLHAMVLPNLPPHEAQLDGMSAAASRWPIAAWKVYTQWGPDGKGWALDDPAIGIPFIERARALGVRTICIHKGLSLPRMSPAHADCADVGRAARLFPDVNFIVYHSGFETRHREGPYAADGPVAGIDSLVRSLQDAGLPPNGNVYAELGSTWRMVMRDPDQAAHALGKLLRHVGENNVLWGTDSIWYGSPQDQILALRSFAISEAFQERFGYPALDRALKRKIFADNALPVYGLKRENLRRRAQNDAVQQARQVYEPNRQPGFQTYGPTDRRGFLALHRLRQGRPD